MKSTDTLLLAPAVLCVVGLIAYVLADMPLSRLCLLVAGLSLAALVVHWVISRAKR
jgi:hypothetical protein